jgi:6-phosphofructokinase 1
VNGAGGSYKADLTVLGHIQSGGSPTSFDRVLASRLGIAAVEVLADADSGKMVNLCGDEICRLPLGEVVDGQRPLDQDLYKLAGVL